MLPTVDKEESMTNRQRNTLALMYTLGEFFASLLSR